MYHVLIPIAIRQTAILRRSCNPSTFRRFSVTPRPQAAENEDSFISKFKNTAIFQKIADKPEALMAIQNFAAMLQEAGIEAGSGMPSKMQMLRLAAREEFRAAAMKVVAELKNAGVDLNSAEAMQEIMSVHKNDSGRDS